MDTVGSLENRIETVCYEVPKEMESLMFIQGFVVVPTQYP